MLQEPGAAPITSLMKSARAAIGVSLAQCAVALVAAVLLRHVGAWDLEVLVFLLAFALVGDRLEVETRVLTISGAFLAIALAMVLLGPVPAAAIGLVTTAADAFHRRPCPAYIVSNVASFLVFPLVGGGLIALFGSEFGVSAQDVNYAVFVVMAFVIANAVNFVQVATTHKLVDGMPFWSSVRSVYLPILPSQLAVALITSGIVYAHAHGGG